MCLRKRRKRCEDVLGIVPKMIFMCLLFLPLQVGCLYQKLTANKIGTNYIWLTRVPVNIVCRPPKWQCLLLGNNLKFPYKIWSKLAVAGRSKYHGVLAYIKISLRVSIVRLHKENVTLFSDANYVRAVKSRDDNVRDERYIYWQEKS